MSTVQFSSLVIPGITDLGTLARLARARKYTQYRRAVANALAGKCPFCDIDPEYNKVIRETKNWHVWPCNPPEKHTRHHFLIVPKQHVKSVTALTRWQWVGVQQLITWLKKEYNFTSCGILCRDGDATLSAGTIEHLHIHVMVPDGTGRVESPFFKGAESEAEGLARAIVFEKMRQYQLAEEAKGHMLSNEQVFNALCAEDRELVKDRLG